MKNQQSVRIGGAVFLLGALASAPAYADLNPPPAPPPTTVFDFYAEPGQLVDIDGGRRINLRCSGDGAPTVVLDIGSGMTSMSWRKVQPLIAAKQRVCSYDRAGFAFSDAGPMPRTSQAEADDLYALVHAAKLATPILLVSHSRATYIARLYASAHPQDIAGLVLVDPVSETLADDAPGYAKSESKLIAENNEFARKCAKAASAGELAKDTPAAKECVPGPVPGMTEKLSDSIRNRYRSAAWWEAAASEAAAATDAANVAAVKGAPLPKNLPLIVLSAEGGRDWVAEADRSAADAAYIKAHQRIAAQSTKGSFVSVDKASHDIQESRPDAIAAAVRKMDALIKAK